MDNGLKHRFSRIFRSSLSSCRNGRSFSDVAEKAVFNNYHRNQSDLSSRVSEDPLLWSSSQQQKPRPFPFICKPRCPESLYAIDHNCMIMMSAARPRRKLSARNSPFVFPDDFGGRDCPPASPASPLFQSNNFDFYEKRKKKRNENKKWPVTKNPKKRSSVHHHSAAAAMMFSSSSQESFSYRRSWWSSSDEEEDQKGNETDTLFSSRSLSSESSSSRRRRSKVADQKTCDLLATDSGRSTKMKDSFAVEKSSSDPYNDFRTSMVEMILEKQIFSASGLEQLLQCFLALNSNRHHRIIVEVFTEIYEALFSDWC